MGIKFLSSNPLTFVLTIFYTISSFEFFLCSAKVETMTPGQSLKYWQQLTSVGNEFALGFFSPGESKNRYVAIWYNMLQTETQTVVWVANRNDPLADSDGVFTFLSDGNLAVLDGTKTTIWNTSISTNATGLVAVLLDSGNLVLMKDGRTVVWQSFDYPFDTLLPEMKIGVNPRTRSNRQLRSQKKENNLGLGRFSFGIDPNHQNQLFIWSDSTIPSWRSGVWNGYDFEEIQGDYNVLFQFTKNSTGDEVYFTYWTSYTYTRLVLDVSGQLQFWIWDGGPANRWTLGWWSTQRDNDRSESKALCRSCGTTTIPYPLSIGDECGDPAYRSFVCDNSTSQLHFKSLSGTYEITSINPDTQTFVIKPEVTSTCSEGNSPRHDINLTNSQQFYITNKTTIFLLGCKTLPISMNCNSSSPCYKYIEDRTMSCPNSRKCCSYTAGDFPSTPHSVGVLNTTCSAYTSIVNVNLSPINSWQVGLEIGWKRIPEPECNQMDDCAAWSNTKCMPHGSEGRKKCICDVNYQWDNSREQCITGEHSASGDYTKNDGNLKKHKPSRVIVILPVVMGSALLVASIYCLWRMQMKKKGNKERILNVSLSQLGGRDMLDLNKLGEEGNKTLDIPFIPFDTIVAATMNFSGSNKLGQGGFGPVYKGKISEGKEIAVKRLSKSSGQGLEEFKNEVILIAKLQHRNLVKLLGYCIQGDEKMLLYEYMPNKSLDSFLFDQSRRKLLNWEKRYIIILGVARGLLYLHQDSRLRIIHRDLKTSNILLDEEMNAKISDFGMARIFGGDQTQENTNRVVGTYGYMSPEYALNGIFSMKSDVFSFGVVLLEIISGKKNSGFCNYTQSSTLLGHAWQLWRENKGLDLMDQTLEEAYKESEVLKCICIGLLCVQDDPRDRPTMASVLAMLSSETPNIPAPKQPAFASRNRTEGSSSSSSQGTYSQNEMTFSTLGGR